MAITRFLLTSVNDNDLWMVDNVTSPTVEYWGYAAPGSLTSAAVWKLMKFTKDANGIIIQKQFAAGTPAYVNIYDSRTSYTYS